MSEEILEKLESIEDNISELREDINQINRRLGLRDQYLQVLMSIHDELKTLAAKVFFKK